jgi:hypothetical protein
VSSKVDSRTIIDSNGAEALLGQGDMLFLPPASSRLIRVHGSFASEAEIKRITDFIRKQAEPDYNEEVTLSEQETLDADGFEGEQDELFDQALAIVTDMGRASTSVLQRRLSIGYGRAAKILDSMERQGFRAGRGFKPRKVLQAARGERSRTLEEDFEIQLRQTPVSNGSGGFRRITWNDSPTNLQLSNRQTSVCRELRDAFVGKKCDKLKLVGRENRDEFCTAFQQISNAYEKTLKTQETELSRQVNKIV